MVDVSGIPNMGFGGGGYFGGSASLGLPAMSADQINASMGWNPNAAQFNPWANTPGGFGGQTDYYSALGASYGRNTGGFGYLPDGTPIAAGGGFGDGGGAASGMPEWQYNQMMKGMGSVFEPSTYAPAPQTFEGMWGGGQSAPQYQLPDEITRGQSYQPQVPYSSGEPEYITNQRNKANGDYYSGGQAYGQPSANPSYFDPSTYGGQSPVYQAWQNVPAYDPNSFANRFAAGGYYNPGTPSQYYTGSNYGGGGGSPPGFAGSYGVDSPGGALPLSPFANPYSVGQ